MLVTYYCEETYSRVSYSSSLVTEAFKGKFAKEYIT
jgi:hypothetical protein